MPGGIQPGAQRRHRAVRGERVGGDVDADAFAFLVRLGAGQQHAQSVRPEAEVRHPDHHQLGAAEGAGEAEQDEGAVAFAAPVAAADRGDPQHVGGEQRCGLALGPGTVAAGDALQGPAQHRVARVERQAQQGVRLDDGGEPAGQGGVGALAGELRQVVGDQGRGGGAGEGAAALAPGLPGAQMAGVGAAGRGRERLAGLSNFLCGFSWSLAASVASRTGL